MNGYKAFFERKQIEVFADSLYAAKIKAVITLRVPPKREHMVSVVLCETDIPIDANGKPCGPGKPVTHTPDY